MLYAFARPDLNTGRTHSDLQVRGTQKQSPYKTVLSSLPETCSDIRLAGFNLQPAALMPRPTTIRSIEFHSTRLDAILVPLTRADPAGLADDMHKMLGGRPDYFNQEPAILDFGALADPGNIDWNGLLSLMRRYRLQPVGTRGLASEAHLAGARRAGLAVLDQTGAEPEQRQGQGSRQMQGQRPGASTARTTSSQSSSSSQSAQSASPSAAPGSPAPSAATLFVDRPVRSGQQIYAQGGDLVLLAGISPGSEVIADGNIHCFGPLAGRALAGARGDANARIIATCFGPELVSIAGVYRTFERGVPDAIGGHAVVVRMKPSAKNQSIIIEPLQID